MLNTWSITHAALQISPGDGAILWFWPNPSLNAFAFPTLLHKFEEDLVIKAFSVNLLCNGTIGSPELTSLYLAEFAPAKSESWYTGAFGPAFVKDHLLTDNIVFSNAVGLIQGRTQDIFISKEHAYCYKLVCPTFATNPTQNFLTLGMSGIRWTQQEGG